MSFGTITPNASRTHMNKTPSLGLMLCFLVGATGLLAPRHLDSAPAGPHDQKPQETRAPEKRSLRIAVVQMKSLDRDINTNLTRATGFAEKAAAQGARLILFPEFMPTGSYLYFD